MQIDPRKLRTRELIQSVFLECLKNYEVSEITVVEICQRAHIARSTFYLHFDDVYSLFGDIGGEVSAALQKHLDATYPLAQPPYDYHEMMEQILAYLFAKRDLIRLLIRRSPDHQFEESLRVLFTDHILDLEQLGLMTDDERIGIIFAVSGVVGTLMDWLKTDTKIDRHHLAATIATILTYFD